MNLELLDVMFRYVVLVSILITIGLLIYELKKNKGLKRKLTIIGLIASIFALLGHIGLWVIDNKNSELQTLAPYIATIHTAESDANLIIKSSNKVGGGTHFSGCICGFVKGNDPILFMMTNQFIAIPKDNGTTNILFTSRMINHESITVVNAASLTESEYFQISISELPDSIEIISGEVRILINGEIRLTIPIMKQIVKDGNIINEDISICFKDFPEIN
jgi:hypothetical protein